MGFSGTRFLVFWFFGCFFFTAFKLEFLIDKIMSVKDVCSWVCGPLRTPNVSLFSLVDQRLPKAMVHRLYQAVPAPELAWLTLFGHPEWFPTALWHHQQFRIAIYDFGFVHNTTKGLPVTKLAWVLPKTCDQIRMWLDETRRWSDCLL